MSGINSRDAEVVVFCQQFILYSCHYKHKEPVSDKHSHFRDGSVLRFRKNDCFLAVFALFQEMYVVDNSFYR